MQLVYFAFQFI